MVKTLLWMLPLSLECLGSSPGSTSSPSFLLMCTLGDFKKEGKLPGSLPLTSETETDFPAPALPGPAQAGVGIWGLNQPREKLSFCLCLSFFAFQINKHLKGLQTHNTAFSGHFLDP